MGMLKQISDTIHTENSKYYNANEPKIPSDEEHSCRKPISHLMFATETIVKTDKVIWLSDW